MAKRTQRRRKSQNRLVRLLSDVPSWLFWLLGVLIAGAYVFFLFHVVLHFSMPWKARYGEVPQPEGYTVQGIDISHYQSTIRWDRLATAEINSSPISFIFMKATEGTNIFDNTFNHNFHQAKINGFIRGAYHFYIPGSSAKQQADYYLSQVHLVPGDLPPVLDVEKSGGQSKQEIQEGVRQWLRIVGNYYGCKPIIYTYYSFKRDYLNTPEFDEYPFWIAHYYQSKLSYKGSWQFWQYTDMGSVRGIRGNVDCNVFNGSLDDLHSLCITPEQFPIDF